MLEKCAGTGFCVTKPLKKCNWLLQVTSFCYFKEEPYSLETFASAKPDQSCYRQNSSSPCSHRQSCSRHSLLWLLRYTKSRTASHRTLPYSNFSACQMCPVMLMPKIITRIYLQNKSIHPLFPVANLYAFFFLQIFPLPNHFLMLVSNTVSNWNT